MNLKRFALEYTFLSAYVGKLGRLDREFPHPSRLVMLPFAVPISFAVTAAYLAGLFLTTVRPSLNFSAWAYSLEKVPR